MFNLHDVPWGKPNYRRQFGKRLSINYGGVVDGEVREGVVVNYKISELCTCAITNFCYFGKSYFYFCLFLCVFSLAPQPRAAVRSLCVDV